MLIDGGAFVLGIAGATPKRRNGLAWRSARGLRAGQSDKQGFQGSWESLLFPRHQPERITPAQQDPGSWACFSPVVAKKEEASVVSDAERNAKAREMDRGSLSIFIVAIESRETIPRKPVSSKGGYRGCGPVVGNTN
jgi:hypothetical protein